MSDALKPFADACKAYEQYMARLLNTTPERVTIQDDVPVLVGQGDIVITYGQLRRAREEQQDADKD